MFHVRATIRPTPRRRGWTLAEILVATTILLVIAGGVTLSGRAVLGSRRVATARAQLALISTAIDRYASFWPAWKIGSITVADKGWPDFVPGRVFAACSLGVGVFENVAGFNDSVDLAGPDWLINDMAVLQSNTCLAYQLLSASGKGPYLRDRQGAGLATGGDFVAGGANVLYPGFDANCVAAGGTARSAEVVVDPWGTPIRYFWVYRDASRTAHRGYLPVDFGPLLNDSSNFGVHNARYQQFADSSATQFAAGYVLESAGPDKKFGNLWKINPTETELTEAEDNLMISP